MQRPCTILYGSLYYYCALYAPYTIRYSSITTGEVNAPEDDRSVVSRWSLTTTRSSVFGFFCVVDGRRISTSYKSYCMGYRCLCAYVDASSAARVRVCVLFFCTDSLSFLLPICVHIQYLFEYHYHYHLHRERDDCVS